MTKYPKISRYNQNYPWLLRKLSTFSIVNMQTILIFAVANGALCANIASLRIKTVNKLFTNIINFLHYELFFN